MKPTNVHNV